MSSGGRPGPSNQHQATDARRPGTPASMTPKERKKQQFENTVNSAIMAATVARNAGDTTPLLGPLKGLMGSLIAMLENVKVGTIGLSAELAIEFRLKGVKKYEEDWERLSSHIQTKIEMLQAHVQNRPASVELQELISNYKE
jgi:hypothetical protein